MRIELDNLGAGQYVEIRNPNKLRWKDQKSITSSYRDDSVGSQMDVAEALTVHLCVSGNVLDADDVPIEFPLTAESVGDVPAELITAVAKAFADARKSETPEKN